MDKDKDIIGKIERAQKSRNEMDQFIQDYLPFIEKTVANQWQGVTTSLRDDLLTIAMEAFQEAVHSYRESKGSFIHHAANLIRLRTIDGYRKVKRQMAGQVPLEGDAFRTVDGRLQEEALERYQVEQASRDRKEEILDFRKELMTWNITMVQLEQHAPKMKKLRDLHKDIAKWIIGSPLVLSNLHDQKKLPIQLIVNHFKVSRRKVERGRMYIIALVIIGSGDYESLQEWIGWR